MILGARLSVWEPLGPVTVSDLCARNEDAGREVGTDEGGRVSEMVDGRGIGLDPIWD